jgi:hypothetical protein
MSFSVGGCVQVYADKAVEICSSPLLGDNSKARCVVSGRLPSSDVMQ